MVECMFIWPHIISKFTCVIVFHNYRTLVDSSLPTYLGICFISYVYEIVYGLMHVYLATHFLQIYLCKSCLQLWLSERTRIHKFLTQ